MGSPEVVEVCERVNADLSIPQDGMGVGDHLQWSVAASEASKGKILTKQGQGRGLA